MKDLLKKFENKKEPVIVLIGKMKQKLKAGLSTLFVVVLPEVEPG
jgi:hypothetical protein